MGDINFKKTRFRNFLKGKGFYIALTLCLVGATGAAYIAVSSAFNDVKNQNNLKNTSSTVSEVQNQWGFQSDTQVDKPQSNVGVTSGSSEPSSSPDLSASSSVTQQDSTGNQSELPTEADLQNLLFAYPISGEVINAFSNHELVYDKTLNDWRTHNGTDIFASPGTVVSSMGDGVVTKVETDPMWGTVVTIDHGSNVVSVYKGLAEGVNVAVDESVSIGQTIGSVSEGIPAEIGLQPHLHFEVLQNGEYVDPIPLIEASLSFK